MLEEEEEEKEKKGRGGGGVGGGRYLEQRVKVWWARKWILCCVEKGFTLHRKGIYASTFKLVGIYVVTLKRWD